MIIDLSSKICLILLGHKGEFQVMPPTNKKINLGSADLYKIENEKIVENWEVVDQLNLLQQTGKTLTSE
jgi:predicted ester cyclase